MPRVPRRIAYAIADIAGMALYALATRPRRVYVDNVATVIDRGDPDLVALRAREAFRTQARNYVDLFSLSRLTRADLDAIVTFSGEQHLIGALARGRGAIVLTGHIGNIDIVIQVGPAHGYRVILPVERIEPPELLDAVVRLRASHGIDVVPIDDRTGLRIVRALRRGYIAAIALDRDSRGTGRSTAFLGRRARLADAAAIIAARVGTPIVPVVTRRVGDRLELEAWPPIVPGEDGADSADDIFRRCVDAVETMIRRTPGQWVMFQPLFDRPKA